MNSTFEYTLLVVMIMCYCRYMLEDERIKLRILLTEEEDSSKSFVAAIESTSVVLVVQSLALSYHASSNLLFYAEGCQMIV